MHLLKALFDQLQMLIKLIQLLSFSFPMGYYNIQTTLIYCAFYGFISK